MFPPKLQSLNSSLWAENSAISLKLFRTLKQRCQSLPHVLTHVSTQPVTESPTQVTTGTQSPSNDQTDALTKAGTLHEESWTFHAPSHIAISPQFAADDLLTLHNADSSLRTMAAHMSYPLEHSISSMALNTSSELCTLHSVKHMLHLRGGVLTYVPEPLTAVCSLTSFSVLVSLCFVFVFNLVLFFPIVLLLFWFLSLVSHFVILLSTLNPP